MARKFRRRRRGRKKTTVSHVKSIVKKELSKTRETQKLVSYLSWSPIPELIDRTTDSQAGLLISLTGGVSPQVGQTVQNPAVYSDKNLFVLLPSANIGGTQSGNQAGQGGMAMDASTSPADNASIGGVHQLEGRECFLKNWYASLIISNTRQQVTSPRPSFVRMVVFETRRPLAENALAQQIFLQNHAVNAMNTSVSSNPETVNSYLNRPGIKKVYMDRLIKLTGPAAADAGASSAQLYTTKLKVRINKKARWTYYYPTRDPVQAASENLVYQGPFIYAMLCSNQQDDAEQPQVALNSMLTFLDD